MMLRPIAYGLLLVIVAPALSSAQVGYGTGSPVPPAAQPPSMPNESAWPPSQQATGPALYPSTSTYPSTSAYPSTSTPAPTSTLPSATATPSAASAWPPSNNTTRRTAILDPDPIPTAVSSIPHQPSAPTFMPSGNVVPPDPNTQSTWYFRQDAYWWNERLDGTDFVKEYGPLSTLGYQRRNGVERFRIELFGGTVAYDGGAQYDDGSLEPYHESNGTNYLGMRGEYDLLLEPAGWTRIRGLLGVGTRFWMRDLHDAITPSGNPVYGYQETWWTFYPYIGLETRESSEPGWQFFGSARVGITPLTYQHATYFDTTLYPRCGLTGQAELGIRFGKCSTSAFIETMTWGESAEVRGSLQPDSRMLTVGGKVGYSF